MRWKEYQKPHQANAKAKNRGAVKEKITTLRNHTKTRVKLHSSVTLPNFSRARLKFAAQKFFRETGNFISESEILIGCLVLLLSKLRHKPGSLRAKFGPRNRLYNEKRYSYEIVPIYADRHLWAAMKARAFELEVSLSFLADLAIRLFLSQVLEKLLTENNHGKNLEKPADDNNGATREISCGKAYLKILTKCVGYQQVLERAKYGALDKGNPAYFQLRVSYSFG